MRRSLAREGGVDIDVLHEGRSRRDAEGGQARRGSLGGEVRFLRFVGKEHRDAVRLGRGVEEGGGFAHFGVHEIERTARERLGVGGIGGAQKEGSS